jgi:hypothetical protein
MATITRGQISAQLIPGLNAVFGTAYDMIDNEHLPLFEIEKSNRSFEEEVNMTGLGAAPEKFEGQSISYDDMRETYKSTYTHVTVALGYAITEEAVEDNLYSEMGRMRAKALGRSMATTKQVRAADIFNNGFSTTQLGGDGVPLFSATHPTLTGDQSNRPAVASDLSETALEQACIDIKSTYKDERGILINARPMSIHIPPQLQFTAEKILKSTLSTTLGVNPTTTTNGATNLNDINALKTMGVFPKGAYVNHRFTDPDAWFVKTDQQNATKHFVRVGLQTGTEGDFDTGNFRYKARERYSFGWSDWRGWYGTTGS